MKEDITEDRHAHRKGVTSLATMAMKVMYTLAFIPQLFPNPEFLFNDRVSYIPG